MRGLTYLFVTILFCNIKSLALVNNAPVSDGEQVSGLHIESNKDSSGWTGGEERTISIEDSLGKMARDYYYEQNYPKALLYGKEAAIIFEQKFKENSRKYSMVYLNALNNLSQYYGSMNKIDEGYECANRAYRLIANGDVIVEDWLKYSVYNNFAVALSSVGRTEESIELLELLRKETNRRELKKININSRLLLAFLYVNCKQDTIRATQEYTEILKAMEDSIGASYSFPEYTSVLHHLRELYKNTDADKSRDYLKREIHTYEEWKTNESIAYANLLLEYIDDTWIESVLEDSKTDSLLLYLRRATNIIKRHINNSSYNMSKNERESYWQRYRNIFTWLIPTISGIAPSKEANSLAYDASLFYKSLLLASEKEYKEVILSSNDSVLIRQYNEYVGHLVFLENMYMRGSPSPFIDSLRTIIRDEEFLLSQRVTRFDRQYKGTNYSWEEIRNSLTPDDVAIEFVSYDAVGDSTMYYEAYMIDSNSAYPQLVYICNEGDLRRLVRMDSIDYNGLSMLIWGNKGLDSFLKGKKNVYFSASGLLNSIGIEYLPIADGKSIQDVYNIYRLSSTRELCFSHEYIKPQDVCLYGGLDYNSPCQIRGDDTRQTYRVSRAVVDSLVSRGGFEPLIGSKQEIDIVKNEMSKNGIICRTYTDSEGTEESLKKLSGCQMNILHLSTHGMFVPFEEEECQVKQINNFRFLLSKESTNVDLESATLSHSFLVMSGGNLLIHRDGLQEGAEDGILTALEISHLDFHDLDLVVLSACQTALGVIGSDGVYGLQRGFKKAGANTILMSLNKVDDEATRILMVEFYKNLMAGKSKYQSLKDAQHYLRQVENGKYDAPKYWASFILLDALN